MYSKSRLKCHIHYYFEIKIFVVNAKSTKTLTKNILPMYSRINISNICNTIVYVASTLTEILAHKSVWKCTWSLVKPWRATKDWSFWLVQLECKLDLKYFKTNHHYYKNSKLLLLDQSKTTTEIWVALWGFDKLSHQFLFRSLHRPGGVGLNVNIGIQYRKKVYTGTVYLYVALVF